MKIWLAFSICVLASAVHADGNEPEPIIASAQSTIDSLPAAYWHASKICQEELDRGLTAINFDRFQSCMLLKTDGKWDGMICRSLRF